MTDPFAYYYMLIMATALLHHDSDRDAVRLLGACAASQFIGLAPIPGMPTSIDHQYVLITAATLIAFTAILIRRSREPAVVATGSASAISPGPGRWA